MKKIYKKPRSDISQCRPHARSITRLLHGWIESAFRANKIGYNPIINRYTGSQYKVDIHAQLQWLTTVTSLDVIALEILIHGEISGLAIVCYYTSYYHTSSFFSNSAWTPRDSHEAFSSSRLWTWLSCSWSRVCKS